MMKRLIFIITILTFHLLAFGQDPSFSTFDVSRTNYNPALTGIENGVRVSILNRQQWFLISNNLCKTFRSSLLNIEASIPKPNLACGFSIIDTQEGDGALRNTGFSGTFGQNNIYKIKSPKRRSLMIHPGYGGRFQATYQSISWNELYFSDQIDPIQGLVKQESSFRPSEYSKWYTSFDLGAMIRVISSKKGNNTIFTFGAAAFHIKPSNISFFKLATTLPSRISIHSSLYRDFPSQFGMLGSGFNIFSILEFQEVYNTQKIGFGINLSNAIGFSSSFRRKINLNIKQSDSFIFTIDYKWRTTKYNYSNFFISYDATISGLSKQSINDGRAGGSIEGGFVILIDDAFQNMNKRKGLTDKAKNCRNIGNINNITKFK